jgi:hypothetical protein
VAWNIWATNMEFSFFWVKSKVKPSFVCSIMSKCVKLCFWKVLSKLQWYLGYGDGQEK